MVLFRPPFCTSGSRHTVLVQVPDPCGTLGLSVGWPWLLMLSFPPLGPVPCDPCSSYTGFLDVSHIGQVCVPWALTLPGMFFLKLPRSSLSLHSGLNQPSLLRENVYYSLTFYPLTLPSFISSQSNGYFLILLYLCICLPIWPEC